MITFGTNFDMYNSTGLGQLTSPAIAPFFSDYDLYEGGEIYWDFDTTNGAITITWAGVEPYGDGSPNSFQVVLTDSGNGDFDVEIIYESILNANTNGIVARAGIVDGNGQIREFEGSGNETFMRGYEVNDFDGGDPDGIYTTSTSNGVPEEFLVDGTAGGDTMGVGYTDADGDQITNDDDYIDAGAGDDTIYGGDGNDLIYGGDGNDTIGEFNSGGDGDDQIYGEAGNDVLTGGSGNDTLYGGADNDWLSGGTGTDYL